MSDATDRAKSERRTEEREPGGPAHRDTGLTEEASRRIGDELKAFYDGLVSEPLPDRFVQLLQQLEKREKSRPAKGKTGAGGADE